MQRKAKRDIIMTRSVPGKCCTVFALRTSRCRVYKFYVLPGKCLCGLYGFQNKPRLFPYTALTDWFLYPRRSVYCAVRTGSLTIPSKAQWLLYVRQV
jgi:hypothetical protein